MYVRMFMCIFMQYMYDEACFFLHFGCYRAENSVIFSERSSSLCQAATHNLENKMAARQRPGWRVQKMIHYIVGRVTMNPKQGYFAEMLSIKLHALNEQHRFTLIVFGWIFWNSMIRKKHIRRHFVLYPHETVAENRALFRVWINL